MQLPTRRAEKEKVHNPDYHYTKTALARLQSELERLERERPALADELRRTAEMGDLSENAAYQHAKDLLRRTNNRILVLKDRLSFAIPIENNGNAVIEIGSTVIVETSGKQYTYEIVGAEEARPAKGRISHLSPVGSALIGHSAGETIPVSINRAEHIYKILEVK